MGTEVKLKDRKDLPKKIVGVCLILSALAVVLYGALAPPVPDDGLQTIWRKCEFIEIEGQIYFRCADGFQGQVAPAQ